MFFLGLFAAISLVTSVSNKYKAIVCCCEYFYGVALEGEFTFPKFEKYFPVCVREYTGFGNIELTDYPRIEENFGSCLTELLDGGEIFCRCLGKGYQDNDPSQ